MKAATVVLCGLTLLGWTTPIYAAAAKAENTQALAVLPFDSTDAGTDSRDELLADLVGVGLAEDFPIVERQQLDKVLAEQRLSLRGLVRPEQAVQAGKLAGAHWLLAGRLIRLGENALLTLRLISTETARFKGLNLPLPGQPSPDQIAARAVVELKATLPRLQQELLAAPAEVPAAEAKTGPSRARSRVTIAVLTYANLGQEDETWAWLGKGLADLTVSGLASQGLRLVNREQVQSVLQERQLQKAAQEPAEVARVLKADRCVHGTFRVAGDQVQLHATLLETRSGQQLHNAAVSGACARLLELQQQLVAELSDVLKGNRPGMLDAAQLPQWTESLKASELLYRGVERFDRGQYLEAWHLFRRALRQDPDYADARYWAGRMLYYLQEYPQARVDLEQFVVAYPKHPRVGDAVMEIINAVQTTAEGPEDVLNVLAFAVQLAPRAEVANQFGTGTSSTVALYAAGLAAKILVDQQRYREAFARLAEALDTLPVESPLYNVGWHELFNLRLRHLERSGQFLPMPPLPRRPESTRPKPDLTPAPPDAERVVELLATGGSRRPDSPLVQNFVYLTPTHDTVEFAVRQEAQHFRQRSQNVGGYQAHVGSYTQYLYTDASHYLTAVDVEVRYRPAPESWSTVQLRVATAEAHPIADLRGQPLLQHCQDYAWKMVLPSDPIHKVAPSAVDVRIVRRVPGVTASAAAAAKRLHLTVHAVAVEGQQVQGSAEAEGTRQELDRMALQLAGRMAEVAGVKLPAVKPEELDDSPVGRLHLMRGISLYYANNPDQAIAALLRAVQLDPRLQEARLWIARAYLQLGEGAHARTELRQLARNPAAKPWTAQIEQLLRESGTPAGK